MMAPPRVRSTRAVSPNRGELLEIGDVAPDFALVDVAGTKRRLFDFRGRRVLLSFFRYAACPVCQYDIDQMKQRAQMIARSGIIMVSIFRRLPETVAKYSAGMANSVALIDKTGSVYGSFQSKKRTFAGATYQAVRKAGGRNYNAGKQLPADYLIDEEGKIVDLFRAQNILDHMQFERVEAFIPENKRCKCNKQNCLSRRCREEYEKMKRESALMIFMG